MGGLGVLAVQRQRDGGQTVAKVLLDHIHHHHAQIPLLIDQDGFLQRDDVALPLLVRLQMRLHALLAEYHVRQVHFPPEYHQVEQMPHEKERSAYDRTH